MTSAAQQPSNNFSINANPIYYALGGYNLKGFYHLPKRFSFGIALEAGFELPDFATDQFFESEGDIAVHWDRLFGAEIRYRLIDADIDSGPYILATGGHEKWTVENVNTDEHEFTNWYSSIGIGYNWYPFKKPQFHLGGSYNIIFILNNHQQQQVGNEFFNIKSVIPPSIIPTLYFGWRF